MKTNNQQFIQIRGGGGFVAVKTRLLVEISPEETGGYFSYCPSLDLCSQGETVKEAKDNVKEAVELFIETCLARGTLHNALARRRFFVFRENMYNHAHENFSFHFCFLFVRAVCRGEKQRP